MRWEFMLRALCPHLVLGASMSGLCVLLRGWQGAPCLAPVLTAVQLAVWYWTDLLLTDRVRGERLIRDSAEYVRADGTRATDSEGAAWLLLAFLFLALNLILLASGGGTLAGIVFLLIDLPLLTLAVCLSDAFTAFRRHVHPRVQRQREIRQARAELKRFYRTHAQLLQDVFPPAMFRAHLSSALGDSVAPEEAWKAARDLIAQLQPVVTEGKERRRLEEQQLKQLDRQIRDCQQEIARRGKTAGTTTTDHEADEIALLNCEETLARLQEERARLLTSQPSQPSPPSQP